MGGKTPDAPIFNIVVEDKSGSVLEDPSLEIQNQNEVKPLLNLYESKLYLWAHKADGRTSVQHASNVFRNTKALWTSLDAGTWKMKPDGSNFDECYHVYLGSKLKRSVQKALDVFAKNPKLRGLSPRSLIIGSDSSGAGDMSVQDLFRQLVSAFCDIETCKGARLEIARGELAGLLFASGTCGCSYQM